MIKSPLIYALATSLAMNLHAATPIWDTSDTGGIQAGSGTWDLNTTNNWTLDNGASRVGWTSNADTASFALQGTNGTVTISNAGGQVGAAGIVLSGAAASSGGNWTITGDTLQLGAGGFAANLTNNGNTVTLSAPISLTASQTWSTIIGKASNSTSGVLINGVISSASGTTNLTFNGNQRYNAASAGSNLRASFTLSANNTFSGTTTVTGGAQLVLNYVTGSSSRLDANSALILSGGTVMMDGGVAGSNYVESVASTTINAGHNTIAVGSSGGGNTTSHLSLGALTHNVGGTLDVSNAQADIARTSTANVNSIIGGWATFGGNRFASVTGVNNAIASTTGSTLNTYSTWAATNNVVVNAAVSGATDKTINTLRVASGGSVTLGAGNTLTIATGGIIGDSGTSISGGNLTTGMSTGELFVHTPSALTISSSIIDNGGTATVLVKAGANTLTLSGNNTYTGGTYINSGTLVISGSATMRGAVTQAGGSTLTIASGGTLSPGAAGATGTMTLAGNLTLSDGAILDFQLGSSSDHISLTNSFATLTGSASAGGITLNLTNTGSMGVQTYSLLDWADGTTLSGFDLSDFTLVGPAGVTGNLELTANGLNYVVTAVPEPSAIALALGGLGVLVLLQKRRRAYSTVSR